MRTRSVLSAAAAVGIAALAAGLGESGAAMAITPDETEQSSTVTLECTYRSPGGEAVPLASDDPDGELVAKVTVTAPWEFLTEWNDFLGSPSVRLQYDILPAIQTATAAAEPGAVASVSDVHAGPAEDGGGAAELIRLSGGPLDEPPKHLDLMGLWITPTPTGGVTDASTDLVHMSFDDGENTLRLDSFRIPVTLSGPSTSPEGTTRDGGSVECAPATREPVVVATYTMDPPLPASTPAPTPTQAATPAPALAGPTPAEATPATRTAALAATGVDGVPVLAATGVATFVGGVLLICSKRLLAHRPGTRTASGGTTLALLPSVGLIRSRFRSIGPDDRRRRRTARTIGR